MPTRRGSSLTFTGGLAGSAILAALGVVASPTWGCRSAQTDTPTDRRQTATFEPTVPNSLPAPGASPAGMVWIPGGEFSMGAADPTEIGRAHV